MDATSHYQIRAVDIGTANYGYLLKISFVGAYVNSHYQFVYLPFAGFSSLLMADFLLASKREAPSLIDELTDAIRNDLQAHPGFILFETEEGARDHWQDSAHVIDETVEATKPINRPAGTDEEYDFAHRPIEDHNLKVFRQVFLGKAPLVRPGTKIDGSKFAYRVIDNELHIDLGKSGTRDITKPTTINQESYQALRDIINKLMVNSQVIFSERDDQQNLYVELDRPEAEREIRHALHIDRQKPVGIRDISNVLYINNNRLAAGRHTTRNALVSLGHEARRSISRKLTLGQMVISTRDRTSNVYVERKYWWGRPKGKQYPGFINPGLFRGLRDRTAPAIVGRHIEASRDIFAPLFIQNDLGNARRHILSDATVNKEWAWGNKELARVTAYMSNPAVFGLRRIAADAYIEHGSKTGIRSQSHGLYVPREIKGFRRTDRGLLLPRDGGAAERKQDHGLILPIDLKYGGTKAAKKLYIDSVQARAVRTSDHAGYVYDGKDLEGDAIKAPKPAVLDEDILGDKTVYPDYGFLEEQIIAHVESSRDASLEELFDADFLKKVYFGTFMEDVFWANVIRELPAHILEDVIAVKDLWGDIMDDIFVGIRTHDGSSWIDMAVEFGITVPEHFGFITPEFFVGARGRIQAIIDSEVTTGIRHNDRYGFVELGLEAHEEAKPAEIREELLGKDTLRPSEIQIENPLGYFDPDPSWIEDNPEYGSRPHDHAGYAEEELIADRPDKPAVLESGTTGGTDKRVGQIGSDLIGDVDPRGSEIDQGLEMIKSTKESDTLESQEGIVDHQRFAYELDGASLADLQKRMALLATGFVFGELPRERAGYVADLYFLGEKAIHDGSLDDGEWVKFASLALRQAIIEEQMFGTDPVKASDLLEHILAFTDPFASHMNEDGVAFTDPFPSHMNEDAIADKQAHYTDMITQIIGDKELAHAIIEDYLIAQQQIKEGILPEPILGVQQLKQALLEEGPVGQSFIYDYISPDDILYQGDDPEFWEDGLGVPEDYDPDDPFNAYYPWTEELNTEILTQDDWLRFGPGNWVRNKEKGEFYAQTETNADGGYYRNEFNHTEYVFTIDFKVDEPAGDAAGIVFKYVNDQNYFKFSVYGDPMAPRNMALHRVTNGQETWLGSPMNPFTWEQGQWYRLEVSVLGNKVKVKVNGRLQYDLVD